MFQVIGDVEATLRAHSFRVFLVGAAALVLIRIVAWFLDQPLRSRTGAGYASDGQLAALGFGAMAASLAVWLWWPVAFGQGLIGVIAVAAVAGVVLHRTAHPPVVIAMGSALQAAFAGAAYLVAWPFLAWVVGAWVAYIWVTTPSVPTDSEKRRQLEDRDYWERRQEAEASRWWREDEGRRQSKTAEPRVSEWPF
jgi:hypothetical protein